ncbi:MAG: DUF1800 domain-containing protein [Bacteroidales bacterium]|nr:DUF1800 domain-containing protein [Bacteroidales bacterium]
MPPLDKVPGNLNEKQAAHLLWRATFGPSKEDIKSFTSISIDAALDLLFASQPTPQPPVDAKTGTTWLNPRSGPLNSEPEVLTDYFMSWHLERMLKSGTNAKEKITWFFHSHLPVRRTLVESEGMYYQNALYRYHAFGSFKELFKRICIDNAMLIYLDGASNIQSSPNENFAREMFELYSIGRGNQIAEGNYTNYTEEDIKAATRVLTGWTNDPDYTHTDEVTSIPAGFMQIAVVDADEIANKHDAGVKQFSSAFNNTSIAPQALVNGYATKEAAEQELDAMINMIFDRDATARFITRKLYRFFVYHKNNSRNRRTGYCAFGNRIQNSGYSMTIILRRLLSSQHFFDSDNVSVDDNIAGAMVKSPLELIFGAIRGFNVQVPDISSGAKAVYEKQYIPGILECIYRQGLDLYEPFDVAGYPAYHQFPGYQRNWVTPHSIAYRYIFADLLLNGVNHEGGELGFRLDTVDWVNNTNHISDPGNAETLVNELLEFMVPFQVPEERKNYFLEQVLLDGLTYASAWTAEWDTYKNNGSNETTIRQRLNALIASIMKSPEYQLM